MARCRFVQPDSVRLDLTDGDWIEVKKHLSVGERRDAMQSTAGHYRADGSLVPNLAMVGLAQIVAYLVDWSLVGPDGKLVVISGQSDAAKLAAVRQLDKQTYVEIDDAIEAHIERMNAEVAARKNGQDGATSSGAISPSAA